MHMGPLEYLTLFFCVLEGLDFSACFDDAAQHLRDVVQPLHVSLSPATGQRSTHSMAQPMPLFLSGFSMGLAAALTGTLFLRFAGLGLSLHVCAF